MPVELEIKLQVPAEARDAVLQAVQALPGAAALSLRARYFDTADGALARASIALRMRDEDGQWVQTLKAAPDPHAPWHRLEHEVPVAGASDTAPALDPALHAASPVAAPLAAIIGPGLAASALVEQYRTEIRRTVATVVHDATTIELAFDEGRIVAGDAVLPVCELECELKSGQAAALAAFAGQWLALHGLWIDPESKAARGTRLARGAPLPPAVASRDAALAPGMSADAAARAMVSACLGQVLPNAGVVAADGTADEHVHQLRIGLRRLRTALAAWRDAGVRLHGLPGRGGDAALRRAFAVLGTRRDGIVVFGRLRDELAAVGLRDLGWLRADVPTAQQAMGAVRSADVQQALLQLMAYALAPMQAAVDAAQSTAESQPRAGTPPAADVLRTQLRRLFKSVRRDGRRFDTLDEARRHRVRRRVKRLRYLAELAMPLFDAGRARAAIAALKAAQDALGAYQDDTLGVACARAATRAGEPQAGQALRWLKRRRKAAVRRCRRALRAVAAAPRPWKRAAIGAATGA